MDKSEERMMGGGGLRERLQKVLPQIAGNSEQAEEERRVPEENMRLLKEVGFTRALLPKEYGGLEVTLQEYGPCVVDLAEACTATAWAAGLLAQHTHGVCLMSRQLQDEVFGADRDALVSSSVAPSGKAVEAKGGIRFSGKFGFSSGCHHAQWALLGFLRAREPGVRPSIHFAVLPRSDYTILDDWNTAGMRGTGSNSITVEDVFVPEHRIDSTEAMNSGTSKGFGVHAGKIFNAAFVTYFSAGFSATAVGTARRMARVYKEKLAGRLHAYTGAKTGQSAPAYMRLAESTHQMNTALAFLEKDWRHITERSFSGELPTVAEIITWRTNQAYVTKLALEAVDRMFSAAGGSAWFMHNEMQRHWRNARMMGSHAGADYDVTAQLYGRQLMDLPPDPGLI